MMTLRFLVSGRNRKRFAASIALSVVLLAGGLQTVHALTLTNAEDSVFYYVVVTADSVQLATYLGNGSSTAAALTSDPGRLSYIPPLGVAPDVGLPGSPVPGAPSSSSGATGDTSGDLAVIGTFVSPGAPSYPLVVVPIHYADRGGAFVMDRTHALGRASIPATALRLPSDPVIIDNRYLDWLAIPALATYSAQYAPESFTRVPLAGPGVDTTAGPGAAAAEKGGIPVSQSLYWGKGGTRIAELKFTIARNYAYMLFSSTDQLATGLSYLLYYYPDRSNGKSPFTVEIPVTGKSGLVVVWEQGKSGPIIVGDYVHSTFYLEARIDLSKLPASLAPAFSPPPGGSPATASSGDWSVDISTGFASGDVREEFYFSTFYMRGVPRM